jgi:hypothetical protein
MNWINSVATCENPAKKNTAATPGGKGVLILLTSADWANSTRGALNAQITAAG